MQLQRIYVKTGTFSHLNQDGENMSFHPSCYYQSPKHQVTEAADIKYVRYGYIGIAFT
jgi:hypothetical protein